MFRNVCIIGNGAMGTVLAQLLCENGLLVRMWGYSADELLEIKSCGENVKYLPGYRLSGDLVFEPDDHLIMEGCDLIVSAVPCQFMRGVWARLRDHYRGGVPVVTVTKGIEVGTLLRPDEILEELLGGDLDCAALSGPTIADELARHLPATACVACEDDDLARKIQETFSVSWFRVYTNRDIVGVELAGALKNVIAIAAGIIDGVGAGDNAKAALLSRGLAEITRLGVACGALAQTFSGLAGLGDLVTTCISPKGRNRSFGERIGKGQGLDEAQNATDSVVEGVATCQSVISLSRKVGVEMPITEAVYQILFEGKPVEAAIGDLMRRQLKAE